MRFIFLLQHQSLYGGINAQSYGFYLSINPAEAGLMLVYLDVI
ncbi:MAG TPA: hypothetical protein VGB89_01755 [Bacteroidota bacterium]